MDHRTTMFWLVDHCFRNIDARRFPEFVDQPRLQTKADLIRALDSDFPGDSQHLIALLHYAVGGYPSDAPYQLMSLNIAIATFIAHTARRAIRLGGDEIKIKQQYVQDMRDSLQLAMLDVNRY